jgi:selenocysteine-specific elongation factor
MPRQALRDRVAARAAPELFDAVLDDLAARSIVRATDRVARADFRPIESAEDTTLRQKICDLLRDAGLKPPDLAALADLTRARPASVQDVVQRLVREKQLVKLDTLVLHPDALDALKRDIQAEAKEGRVTIDVTAFKDRYGLTRKFAIPLLEWLDRERVTRRVGDQRTVIG